MSDSDSLLSTTFFLSFQIITLKPKEADLQHCENAHSQPGKSSTTDYKEPRLHKEIAVDKVISSMLEYASYIPELCLVT